jgi:hypothetical protein
MQAAVVVVVTAPRKDFLVDLAVVVQEVTTQLHLQDQLTQDLAVVVRYLIQLELRAQVVLV